MLINIKHLESHSTQNKLQYVGILCSFTTCPLRLSSSGQMLLNDQLGFSFFNIKVFLWDPLGSFGCVSLFPQVDHFCLFGLCLHSPARILSPSVPYSPQAEELVDHAEMVDGFGHLRWMRDSLTRSDGSSIGQLNQTEINLKILQEDLKAVHTVHIS